MTAPNSLADALAGGSRYIKWDELGKGASVTGTIVNVEMRQARKFQSTDLDFWDDGKPKMQAVITLATSLRDPQDSEDDGTRSISVNLWSGQKQALAAACKAANVTEPQPRQQFTATWASGVGKTGDPRIFTYALGPVPAAGLGDALGTGGTVDTTTGEISPPAAPAPVAAPAAGTPDPQAVAAALAALTPEQRTAMGLPAA
jgi:hypothetical protein